MSELKSRMTAVAMYQYDDIDRSLVNQRVAQFRGQVDRYLNGELTDDEFKQLRLRNGLYLQRHAHMLRVAIPYGLLSSGQMRTLGRISEKYDHGYGHFTTRQNIQYNWPELKDVPDILQELADVDMHAIQTSGNCIRNVTSDHLAGVAKDEIEDPRPYCEIIRQWSSLHPEFSWLPRKFKIAVTGGERDRAAIKFHDIGLRVVTDEQREPGFEVWVGGGMGRTPVVGKLIRGFLPRRHLLSYLEAILRIYNLLGRRDNLHKARIKILVNAVGIDEFHGQVEREWQNMLAAGESLEIGPAEVETVARHFRDDTPPDGGERASDSSRADRWMLDTRFADWHRHNTLEHKNPGYRIVMISLKGPGVAPGDIRSSQMYAVADIAERFSRDEIRSTHEQNLVLAYVKQADIVEVWRELDKHGLATPNIDTLNDMICCPGLDFCSLANAGTINIARQINEKFDRLDRLYGIGEVKLKMSGCMNACGHHDVGHIGILGVDKRGQEWYQITLGGRADDAAAIGKRLGPSLPGEAVADAIERIINVYIGRRKEGERFIDTYARLGIQPFKDQVYVSHHKSKDSRQSVVASA
ncbi:MAG: Sulfite reductase [ferredoxin] [Gammaproteobacteria bacterium]|nr:Sulfite reductase [ferredoxin] [Gammaproteobacteria bacterium]